MKYVKTFFRLLLGLFMTYAGNLGLMSKDLTMLRDFIAIDFETANQQPSSVHFGKRH